MHKWTDEDIAFMNENWGTRSPLSIAIKLGRTEGSVKWKYCSVKGATLRYRWTEEEETWLRENYGKVKMKEITEHLGRSSGTIRFKAHELGISRKGYFKNTSP